MYQDRYICVRIDTEILCVSIYREIFCVRIVRIDREMFCVRIDRELFCVRLDMVSDYTVQDTLKMVKRKWKSVLDNTVNGLQRCWIRQVFLWYFLSSTIFSLISRHLNFKACIYLYINCFIYHSITVCILQQKSLCIAWNSHSYLHMQVHLTPKRR